MNAEQSKDWVLYDGNIGRESVNIYWHFPNRFFQQVFNSFANFSINVCWDPESNKLLAIENLFS